MRFYTLKAGCVGNAKRLDEYKRMGICVSPQMTLAPDPAPRRSRKKTV